MSLPWALQKLALLFLAIHPLFVLEAKAAAVYIKSPKISEGVTSHDKRAVLITSGVLWENGRVHSYSSSLP